VTGPSLEDLRAEALRRSSSAWKRISVLTRHVRARYPAAAEEQVWRAVHDLEDSGELEARGAVHDGVHCTEVRRPAP
jgi:hypothetical protein